MTDQTNRSDESDRPDEASRGRRTAPARPRRLVQLAAAAAGAAALVGAAVVTTSPTASATAYDQDLKDVRVATARFHSVDQALRAGYLASPECVAAGPLGAMGFHYENPALMADPAVDAAKPEILLYAPGPDGDLELVAVEYFRNASDGGLAPSLYGHTFDGPMPGHHPGMGVHYDLHVWVWQANPSGTFAQFNPDVSC